MSDYLNKMNGQSKDHDMYQEAEQKDNLESYKSYLEEYPNGMWAEEVRERISILEKEQREKKLEDERQIEANVAIKKEDKQTSIYLFIYLLVLVLLPSLLNIIYLKLGIIIDKIDDEVFIDNTHIYFIFLCVITFFGLIYEAMKGNIFDSKIKSFSFKPIAYIVAAIHLTFAYNVYHYNTLNNLILPEYVTISSEICVNEGGSFEDGECKAEQKIAENICRQLDARLPNEDELKSIVIRCNGHLFENKFDYEKFGGIKEFIKYKNCIKQQNFNDMYYRYSKGDNVANGTIYLSYGQLIDDANNKATIAFRCAKNK